ncbi:hypothetical protein D3C86_1572250 [compost metagenome]
MSITLRSTCLLNGRLIFIRWSLTSRFGAMRCDSEPLARKATRRSDCSTAWRIDSPMVFESSSAASYSQAAIETILMLLSMPM